MSVRIKISKTDPFRSSQTIVIGRTDQKVCPVLAMTNYLSYRGTTLGPLFQYLSGAPLTKAGLTSETRQLLSMSGFQPFQYPGHSYRIGAATTWASVGLPPWLIKTLGRWSSDCYETSPTMPRHIRGFYVASARKFKLNNDPSCPDNKKKWPTSANSMCVLRDYKLISQVS